MSRRKLFVALLVAAGVASVVPAGDLEPPGPPAPTMKTLDQIEPRTPIHAVDLPLVISQEGSYYLAETLSTSGAGITIATSNVTLDLRGFALRGGTGYGIQAVEGVANIEVKNGTVSNWDRDGVDLSDAPNSRVVDLRVEENGLQGIRLGENSMAVNCSARNNAFFGIIAFDGSAIRGCTAEGNGFSGIAAANTTRGVSIIDCVSRDNQDHGIQGGFGTLILSSTASSNVNDGIHVGTGSRVADSIALSNGKDGIAVMGAGVEVTGCTSRFNTGDGIEVTTGNFVSGNLSTFNDQAGIRSISVGNRIEGNTLLNNDTGLIAEFAGNLIIKNAANNNTAADYDIAPGNSHGPIVNVSAVGDITAAASSEHPWANFSY